MYPGLFFNPSVADQTVERLYLVLPRHNCSIMVVAALLGAPRLWSSAITFFDQRWRPLTLTLTGRRRPPGFISKRRR